MWSKRELCGATAAATDEWVLEFQARQLDVVGLQECRVTGNKKAHIVPSTQERRKRKCMEWGYSS